MPKIPGAVDQLEKVGIVKSKCEKVKPRRARKRAIINKNIKKEADLIAFISAQIKNVPAEK